MSKYTDEQLTAFLDGELPQAHMRAIERAIETDPRLSARVAGLHLETGGLKAIFDSWLAKAPREALSNMMPALVGETRAPAGTTSRKSGLLKYLMVAILFFAAGYYAGDQGFYEILRAYLTP